MRVAFGSSKKRRTRNRVHSISRRDPYSQFTWTDRRDSASYRVSVVTWGHSSETGTPRPPAVIQVLQSEANAPLSHLGVSSPRLSNPYDSFSHVGNCLGCDIGFSSDIPRPTGYQPKAV